MMDSYRPALSRSALLCLSLIALSCGGETKPPIKDLPQAVLTVPEPNTIGTKLTVNMSASGCDAIQSLSVYDGEDFVKTVPYSGGGTISVDLTGSDIKYTRGIAAKLTLKARVVCTDGRQNDSQQAPAVFFPAAEVIDPPAGTDLQVVPDYFVAEGQGVLLNFIGCGNLPNGVGRLFRVDKRGNILASVDMAFPCTVNTVITGMDPTSRKRWVWTPRAGIMAVDEQLRASATPARFFKAEMLSVGIGGDALAYSSSGGLYRIDHETGQLKWNYLPEGYMIAPALPNSSGVVQVASLVDDNALGGAVIMSTVDYGTGNKTSTFLVKQVPTPDVASVRPPVSFNADGSLLYIAVEGANQLTTVFACATLGNECIQASERWVSPVIPGRILALVPYANGGRLAVISARATWVLDSSTGVVINKNQQPLTSEGALITLQVQPGGGPYPHSFYLLNGPVPTEGLPTPMPVEIVATDTADKGELYRYQVNASSMAAAVDSTGTLWLRVGRRLVRPLTPPEYRQVRPVTP
jgi:hypothetical protein